MNSFEEYWQLQGSRTEVASHEERARLAWLAALAAAERRITRNFNQRVAALNVKI